MGAPMVYCGDGSFPIAGNKTAPKMEIYAQCRALGGDGPDCYAQAGYKPSQVAYHRLEKHSVVQTRINWLRINVVSPAVNAAVEKSAMSKPWLMERLQEVIENCMVRANPADKDSPIRAPGVAIRGIQLAGMEFGMFVQRTEDLGAQKLLEQMTAERLSQERHELTRRIAELENMRSTVAALPGKLIEGERVEGEQAGETPDPSIYMGEQTPQTSRPDPQAPPAEPTE